MPVTCKPMHVTFILPSVGRKPDGSPYPASWIMEPLSLATLSALTPAYITRAFHDDRLESIPFDAPTDLVALSVETYSARRAYQIARRYRERGVPVVMGGFHPSLVPQESAAHADAIVTGPAEAVWKRVLDDVASGSLQARYDGTAGTPTGDTLPDRSLYHDKRYPALTLIESGRGCPFSCEFCSITSFYQQTYTPRPIDSIVAEIQTAGSRHVFFTDDNLVVNRERSLALFEALIPLKVRWVSQMSIQAAHDRELLALMRRSGCAGVLIGFESLNADTLKAMGKSVNLLHDYDEPLANLRDHRLAIYATFVFGYDGDALASFEQAYRFAQRHAFFFCAFNHLVPFPGTPLYARLLREGRLLYDPWWLDDTYTFGDVTFRPADMTARELADTCQAFRQRFYRFGSILRRGLDLKVNVQTPFMAALFLAQNLRSRREILLRWGLPLGMEASCDS